MTPTIKHMAITSAAVLALATTGWAWGQAGMMQGPGHGDRAERMQQHLVERQALLKDTLQLTPDQAPAWTAYVNALTSLTPSAMPHRTHSDGAQSTPERMEAQLQRMQAHQAMMTQRLAATKALYDVLTPTQRAAFDAFHAGQRSHGMHPRHS